MLFGLGTKAWTAIASSVVMVSAVVAGVAVAGDDDFEPVYAPEWQPGYTFSYDVSGTVDALTQGLEDVGVPSDVSGEFGPFLVKKEVLNTADYESNGQPLYVSAANFPLSNIQSGGLLEGLDDAPTFLMAERQSDLAPLAVLPNWDCQGDDCAGGALSVFADNPLTYLDFPLTEGKRWVQEEDLPIPVPIEELAGVTRVHIVGEVTGMESVDLGELGTTDAVRVDFAYRPVGLEDILSQVAEQAEQAGIEIERFNIQLGVHEIVHYSPEYEAIVQQQYLISVLFDVAFSGEVYGQSFDEDIYAELNGQITALLAGSNRAVAEQQTPTQILQKLGNVDLISDARGIGAVTHPGAYSLGLVAANQEANVAEQEALRFIVDVAGELPEGHTLDYVVRGLDGVEHQRGAAGADGFSVVLAEPGVYAVSVQALDAAGELVTTSAARLVEGDYEAMVDASCGIGLLGASCDEYDFPVMAGADSAVFEVMPSQTMSLSETLYVAGPDGTAYDTYGRHIELDAAQIAEMGYGEWSIRYENVGGHLTQAMYLIDVDYEAPFVHDTVAQEPEGNASSGGGVLDLMGRMVQVVDSGLQGMAEGQVEVELGSVLE